MDFDSQRIYHSAQGLAAPPVSFSDDIDPFADEENLTEEEIEARSNAESEKALLRSADLVQSGAGRGEVSYSLSSIRRHFREFLRSYKQQTTNASSAASGSTVGGGGGGIYLYRSLILSKLRRATSGGTGGNVKPTLTINLAHLNEYDPTLLLLLMESPARVIDKFEEGARDAWLSLTQGDQDETDDLPPVDEADVSHNSKAAQAAAAGMNDPSNNIQILVKSPLLTSIPLRQICSANINHLKKTTGIIISSTRIRSKATKLVYRCKKCGDVQTLRLHGSYSGCHVPSICAKGNKECGILPYELLVDQSTFMDTQSLKLQESPENVPAGEMPRNLLLAVERGLVDKVSPGMRVSVIGVVSVYSDNGGGKGGSNSGGSSAKTLYIRVLGMSSHTQGVGPSISFSPAEEAAFLTLSRNPNIYTLLSQSIAPSISGDYTVDIKKALTCQLLGGSRKILPDGVKLRGDINLLLMGDPSTAKSQFLKFIEKVAPVGVYTSGKGSSAAGLTASVIKDSRGEFYLEGGAMVLADGGIVCIDEFDKMRPSDRVAIHEAMEQQTISIAKAGITTVLNSRASVLAAANPVFGRYDDERSAGENIDLMSTILSRFDLIFIVRDVRDEVRDRAIARHVMGVHVGSRHETRGVREEISTGSGGNSNAGEGEEGSSSSNSSGDVAMDANRVAAHGGDMSIPLIKKYVQYCRTRCSPRLSPQAAEVLSSTYVKIREEVRQRSVRNGGDTAQVVPITVRQLEALVRLSESLAKMRLSKEVGGEDIQEGLRLFKVSTMAASEQDDNNQNLNNAETSGNEEYLRAEVFLKSRLGLNTTLNKARLIEEAVGMGWNAGVVGRVMGVMGRRGEVVEKNGGRLVKRVR